MYMKYLPKTIKCANLFRMLTTKTLRTKSHLMIRADILNVLQNVGATQHTNGIFFFGRNQIIFRERNVYTYTHNCCSLKISQRINLLRVNEKWNGHSWWCTTMLRSSLNRAMAQSFRFILPVVYIPKERSAHFSKTLCRICICLTVCLLLYCHLYVSGCLNNTLNSIYCQIDEIIYIRCASKLFAVLIFIREKNFN